MAFSGLVSLDEPFNEWSVCVHVCVCSHLLWMATSDREGHISLVPVFCVFGKERVNRATTGALASLRVELRQLVSHGSSSLMGLHLIQGSHPCSHHTRRTEGTNNPNRDKSLLSPCICRQTTLKTGRPRSLHSKVGPTVQSKKGAWTLTGNAQS